MPFRSQRPDKRKEVLALTFVGWALLPPLLTGLVMPVIALVIMQTHFAPTYSYERAFGLIALNSLYYFFFAAPFLIVLSFGSSFVLLRTNAKGWKAVHVILVGAICALAWYMSGALMVSSGLLH